MTSCTTCTGERCDVAVDDSFASDNITGDVIDRDDNIEPNGNDSFFSVTVDKQKAQLPQR